MVLPVPGAGFEMSKSLKSGSIEKYTYFIVYQCITIVFVWGGSNAVLVVFAKCGQIADTDSLFFRRLQLHLDYQSFQPWHRPIITSAR